MQADPQLRARRIALPSRGGDVAAYDFGPPGRPIDVVFSHANGFNARTYLSIVAPLASQARILLFDLRGHGGSGLPIGYPRSDWSDLADDLVALLAAEKLTDAVLAGHSMGATTSLMAAAAAPTRVRAVALFDPVFLTPDQQRATAALPVARDVLKRRRRFASRTEAQAAYAGRGAFRTWSARMLADYVADGFHETSEGVELACRPEWEHSNYVSQGHDSYAALARSQCAVRILKAAEGSTCAFGHVEVEALGQGRVCLETIEKTSHFLPMERPELVVRTLEELVESGAHRRR